MIVTDTDDDWTSFFNSEKEPDFDEDKVGKWRYFFSENADLERIDKICCEAILKEIVLKCKHSNFENLGYSRFLMGSSCGVCSFYLNVDDLEGHKKVINYFIQNDMIQKTSSGRYYNISFKLSSREMAGRYGSDYDGKIKLSNFIDLETGEWIAGNGDFFTMGDNKNGTK